MTSRRHFLRTAAFGGLAGAASLLAPRAFAADKAVHATHSPDAMPANPGDVSAPGYRPPHKYGELLILNYLLFICFFQILPYE